MDLRPGIIRENITTDGLNVNSLQIGQQLRIGEARLEVSEVCNPCDQMAAIRPGLRKALWGRRGMLCRVLEGGGIGRGGSLQKPYCPLKPGGFSAAKCHLRRGPLIP